MSKCEVAENSFVLLKTVNEARNHCKTQVLNVPYERTALCFRFLKSRIALLLVLQAFDHYILGDVLDD